MTEEERTPACAGTLNNTDSTQPERETADGGRWPGWRNTLENRWYYVLYVLIFILYNTQEYYARAPAVHVHGRDEVTR